MPNNKYNLVFENTETENFEHFVLSNFVNKI